MTGIDTIIKRLMDYHGLNQEELADKYKFDPSQVSRWLNGKSIPRGEDYMKLQEEYDQIKDEVLPLLKMG